MRSPDQRAWVLLPSGKRLDLLNPAPLAWEDTDLALGLARTYRWGGHSAWALPLSVAQHSLLVLAIRRHGRERLASSVALRELLHDADEGLLGFDPISPIKPFLGEGFAALAGRLTVAIHERYRLPPWTPEENAAHKQADHLAAASEAVHVVGWSREEVRTSLGITREPLMRDPTPRPDGMRPWEPWPPSQAAALFLAELHRLHRHPGPPLPLRGRESAPGPRPGGRGPQGAG